MFVYRFVGNFFRQFQFCRMHAMAVQRNVEFVSASITDDKHRMNRHKLQHQTKNYSILIRKSFYLRERFEQQQENDEKNNVENTNRREKKNQGLQC